MDPGGGKKCVLLIEDDPDVRQLTEFVLRDHFRLLSASNGEMGIETARTLRPDLILLDVYMAGMSGFEVCSSLKGDPKTSSIPIIMFTAGALKQEVIMGYKAGADDYIIKPFDNEELVERIWKMLEKYGKSKSLRGVD